MAMSLFRHKYRMVSTKDDPIEHATEAFQGDEPDANNYNGGTMEDQEPEHTWPKLTTRQTYQGSLLFNCGAFILPALYVTLSKLWVAKIDSSQVVTTDVYTYIGTVAEILNEGLPRAAWVIIGDRTTRTISSRVGFAYSLVIFQIVLGAILTIVFVSSSDKLAAAFVPVHVRETSLTYVRISSVLALSSAMEVAVGCCTRALDQPDVPLLISTTKFFVNIILDLLIISKFHVGSFTPTVNTQALIRMSCDMVSALSGLVYFIYIAIKVQRQPGCLENPARPGFTALKILARPGAYTFAESAIRNAIYLWLITGIVSMGDNYATAWGVFNTIRWGLIMVPVQSLEASTLTFVGHAWGKWRARVGSKVRRPKASRQDLLEIARPAFISSCIALAVEVPICIFLSTWGMERFAYYLSESTEAARITKKMWRTIDWCYIFYALDTQVAAILLATTPRWYLYQALGSNFLWMMPWAIAVTKVGMTADTAWKYHSVIFGGALLFSFSNASLVCLLWAWRLARGKISLRPVHSTY